jgi:hypothetical protein
MNFNFGEVLARAWQITWRYKSLWLAGIVISLISFLTVPINMTLNPSFGSFADPSEVSRQLPAILLVNGLIILLSILSIPVYAIGMSVPSLGTLQVEKGNEKVGFGELVRASFPYFWRVLGIFLLVSAGVFIVAMVFTACIAFVGILTFGVGAILCAIPGLLISIPLWILVYAVMEQGIAAVLVDDLGFSGALQRAWELVRKNFGAMVLMSLIIYLGSMIVGMIVSIPMLIPAFGFMTDMLRTGVASEPDPELMQAYLRNMMWWMLAFSPLYAVLQGILLSFMQSAWTLTYLRLTRSPKLQPLPAEATA